MRRYVITGAPGTGKTALVEALSDLGTIVSEPARELIAEHRLETGEASLDGSPDLFVERLVARSVDKFESADEGGITVYDRGIPDCAAYAAVFGVDPGAALRAAAKYRYEEPVFLAPPWEDIYTVDDMRRATFDQVVDFHHAIVDAYESLNYDTVELSKSSVANRVGFFSKTIGL